MSDLKKHIERIQQGEAADNFAKWFNDGGICDENDYPLVLYSGTLSDFDSFDLYHTQPESFFGQGFYLSTSKQDAAYNYASFTGQDFVNKVAELKSKFEQDTLDILNDNYQYEINHPEESEINAKIALLHQQESEGLDVFEDIYRAVEEYHVEKVISITHGGMVMPLLAVSKKLIDVQSEVFTQEETFGVIDELFEHFCNEYDEIYDELRDKIISKLSPNTHQYTFELDEFKEIVNDVIESIDPYEDDLVEEINQYVEDFFSTYNNEIEVNNQMAGTLNEFKNNMTNLLIDHGFDKEAESFSEALYREFADEDSNYISVAAILNNDRIIEILCDVHVESSNVYNQTVSGVRALSALAFRKMGYDGIVMNPYDYFEMKHVDENTKHYILFDANNIKSAIGNNGEFSLMDNNILHRISHTVHANNKKEKSMTLEEAEHLIQDITLHYKNMPKCKVYSDLESVHPALKAQNPDLITCSGIFDLSHNTVHIFLPNVIDKKDFIKTLCHEVFGHMSLREVLAEKYEPIMNKVYHYYNKRGELEDVKKNYIDRYSLDLNKSKDRALIAEEKMASVIEENGLNSFPLKKIVIGAIRNAIRTVIPALNINDNDITYIMYSAHKHILLPPPRFDKKHPKMKQ